MDFQARWLGWTHTKYAFLHYISQAIDDKSLNYFFVGSYGILEWRTIYSSAYGGGRVQASKNLTLYPGNIRYDKFLKRYVLDVAFKPAFMNGTDGGVFMDFKRAMC